MTHSRKAPARSFGLLVTGLLVTIGLLAGASTDASAFFAQENKCLSKLGKSIAKVNKTYFKAASKCHNKEIAGKVTLPCPSLQDQAKITKAIDKAIKTAGKSCGSVCSASAVPCVTSRLCPPNGSLPELCSGGQNKFDIDRIGFPGGFCEGAAALNHQLQTAEDIGECAGKLASTTSANFITNVYGSITNLTGITPAAGKCLASVAKASLKLADTAIKGIFKCRDGQNNGKNIAIDPADCVTLDTKLAAKIVKAETKLDATLDGKCTDADIALLELCNGTATTIGQAKACLRAGAREIAESEIPAKDRLFSAISLRDAGYPPAPGCGDGVVNQVQNAFQLLGEECDGADDSACPGQCGAPGDVFQCTCLDVPRVRFFADGQTSDLDNGWTGKSHNQQVPDNAGFFSTRENCDCSAFDTVMKCDGDLETVCTTNADCPAVGGGNCTIRSQNCVSSGDSLCDIVAPTKPVCAFDPSSSITCDEFGDGILGNTDQDCTFCDAFTQNAFTSCSGETDCQSQCFDDLTGLPVGLCTAQEGPLGCKAGETCCPAGQSCRGRCLPSTCLILPNGAPLAISAGGTSVCVQTTFVDDVTGTQDIVSGAHGVFVDQNSKINLGISLLVPCPVCGGFCLGGQREGDLCEGTCSTSGDNCRFDVDCPGGETCTSVSPNCPGSSCNLSLVCGGAGLGGLNAGDTCTIEASSFLFGTVSNDCQPNNNISGKGLSIRFFPQTSENVVLPDILDCENPGDDNYKCPCPGGGVPGRVTSPNDCIAACNAVGSPEFGQGCGINTDSKNGFPTTCTGGLNAGDECDEDADCDSNDCSTNPTHCVGDPAFEFQTCTVDADCGLGTCVDACPTGKCVPLCLPENDPLFGNPGGDVLEGFCAGGPSGFNCSGEKFVFLQCEEADAAAGCNALCSTCTVGANSGQGCIFNEECDPSRTLCSGLCSGDLCTGGSNTGQSCVTDTDCGSAGVCTPTPPCANALQCAPGDTCAALDKGNTCSNDSDCSSNSCSLTAVGVCTRTTSCNEQGQCAAGEFCTGDCEVARLCGAGADTILGNLNDLPGGGICVPTQKRCFFHPTNATCLPVLPTPESASSPCAIDADCPDVSQTCTGPGASDGGFGGGDASNPISVAVFCIAKTTNSSVNSTAGLGGPGRLRQTGINVPNFDCLGPLCP